MLHNNLGGMGNVSGPQSADSQLPDACVGKKQDDACSTAMVIGNVTDPDSAYRVTNEAGVVIDLYIETTTAGAPYVPKATNELKPGAAGTPTFGQINLKGPDELGTREVNLTFTFKRRDTRAEVQIPWMQFTLFDFDHNMNDGKINWEERGQECATASGFEDYAVSSGDGVISSNGVGNGVATKVNRESLTFENNINTGKWCSMDGGVGGDNPSNPEDLTDVQKARSVSFFFRGFSKFDVTLSVKNTRSNAFTSGRYFSFAGVALQIEVCPSPPLPPTPPPPSPSPPPPSPSPPPQPSPPPPSPS